MGGTHSTTHSQLHELRNNHSTDFTVIVQALKKTSAVIN